jgi:hypothetical protein
MKIYRWQEIEDVPLGAGVYAWYYTPEITAFDLECITAKITELKALGDSTKAKEAIRAFLDEHVFQYFREQPFTVRLHGPLKPRYEGQIDHMPTLSENLLDRIVDDPARLTTIRDVLEASVPDFASPIYIGMSERLRDRLRQHKVLIERYGEVPSGSLTEDDQRDNSFASEICARSIPRTRLSVGVKIISGPPRTYIDIENILNRVHYPLLGRN